MSDRNIIPFDKKEKTKKKLVNAVGTLLAKEGFKGIDINKIARIANVDKKYIYRYFDGLPGLIYGYSKTVDFWPTVEELMGLILKKLKAWMVEIKSHSFFKVF